MEIFLNLILLCVLIIVLLNTIYAMIYNVANMPSSPQTRNMIAEDIQSQLAAHTPLIIVDLGSGWGGLCRKLANIKRSHSVKGYEISIVPFVYSRCIQAIDMFRSYSITRGNLFDVDVADADAVVCYLSPYHMKRFEKEIVSTMKSGSILYSQGFPLKDRDASYTLNAPRSLEKHIYCYVIE